MDAFRQHSWGCGSSSGLGYRICVLEQVEGSVPLQEFSVEPGQAYAIIAGHEVKGVDQEVVDAADCCIVDPSSAQSIRWMCRSARESPSGISSVICSFKRLSKIHITFLLCFWESCHVFLFILRSCSYGYSLIKLKIHQTILLKIGIM